MPWPCFLVERFNERRAHAPHVECPKGSRCRRPEHRWTVFDVRRTDTGEVLAEASTWIGHDGVLPAGAMWLAEIEVSRPNPTGPQDWSMNTEAELEMARAYAVEHPNGYGHGVDPATGLPNKGAVGIFRSGPHLMVMTPGGVWNVDSRASNCTLPWDYEHRCWNRTGEPPKVTAGKTGPTCAAGAGSIQCGSYHGFLIDGVLT